jgi:hypothetical protein
MSATDPPNSDDHRGRTHEHRYYRLATPIATVALIVSCISAGFTWWQASLIRESNEITRTNNVVSQRAFVNISYAGIYLSPTPVEPKAANFFFNITNSGNTATKELKVVGKCAPSAEDMQEPWALLYQQPTSPTEPGFIGPHQPITNGCSFSFEQIRAMSDGKLFGYIMFDIGYRDRLDDRIQHKTQMTMFLQQVAITQQTPNPQQPTVNSVTFLGVNRGKHNCADEECP